MPVRIKLENLITIHHILGCIAVYYHHIAIAIIVTQNSNQNEEKPVLTFPSSLELNQLPNSNSGAPHRLTSESGFSGGLWHSMSAPTDGSSVSSLGTFSTIDAVEMVKMPWLLTRTFTFTLDFSPSFCAETF